MKRRYKVLNVGLAVMVVAVFSLALILSHESDCDPAPPLPAGATPMNAIVNRCYGGPEVLTLEQIAKPVVEDDRLLVKVHAASVNPLDWHYMRGKPYVMRMGTGIGAPDNVQLGVDFAGTVEAVGKNVTQFKPGDEVFGGRRGAFAEYVSVAQDGAVTLKPSNMTFEQAAAVPIAAITALQALRDVGNVQPGHTVLINGASGGVGTFAVQIAKVLGAEVTGVCSTRNVDMVRSLGADHVVDYTKENFTQGSQQYDLIVDNVSSQSLSDCRRVLKSEGTMVIVGGLNKDPFIGALWGPIKAKLAAPFVSQKLVFMMADLSQADLGYLRDMMESGKLTPVIDRTYSLSETPAAIGYLEEGHARGKVIIDLMEVSQ